MLRPFGGASGEQLFGGEGDNKIDSDHTIGARNFGVIGDDTIFIGDDNYTEGNEEDDTIVAGWNEDRDRVGNNAFVNGGLGDDSISAGDESELCGAEGDDTILVKGRGLGYGEEGKTIFC